jgi:hypothetical protein
VASLIPDINHVMFLQIFLNWVAQLLDFRRLRALRYW